MTEAHSDGFVLLVSYPRKFSTRKLQSTLVWVCFSIFYIYILNTSLAIPPVTVLNGVSIPMFFWVVLLGGQPFPLFVSISCAFDHLVFWPAVAADLRGLLHFASPLVFTGMLLWSSIVLKDGSFASCYGCGEYIEKHCWCSKVDCVVLHSQLQYFSSKLKVCYSEGYAAFSRLEF